MNLPTRRGPTPTLSHWERVAAKGRCLRRPLQAMVLWQPGEGLHPSPLFAHDGRGFRALPKKTVTPHPPPPAAPSPTGRGLGRLFKTRIRRTHWTRPRDVRNATNFFHHPVKAFLDFFVAKPKLDEAVTFNGGASLCIALGLIEMLFAIHFDRQSEIETAKICDKSVNRHLAAKFEPVAAAITKLLPKQVFGRRASCPQASRNSGQPVGHAMKCEDNFSRSQPLTRRPQPSLRRLHKLACVRHPLPLGEGQRLGMRS